MSAPSDLIERADSLMQRKRIFVANAVPATSNDQTGPAEDEDIPTLTEIVDISEVSSDAPNTTVHPALDAQLEGLTQAFSRHLHQRFAAELPQLINEATARLAIEMQQRVHRITEESLHEFLARHRQIPLPLSESHADQE